MNKTIIFACCYIIVKSVFNISSSHVNTKLLKRRFSNEQFLISKYSSILHALLHSQSHVLVSYIYHLFRNPNHLILYIHTGIYRDSFFVMNYINFHSIHIYTNMAPADSGIWIINSVTFSATLINTDNKWIKKVPLEFISTIVGLA